jgi:hypothetical protein
MPTSPSKQVDQASKSEEKVKCPFDHCRRVLRKRVTLGEERLKKNRKVVDHHLRRMGNTMGKDLSLNADGICYFPFKKFIIVVEVPEDNPGLTFLYTMVCRLSASDNSMEVTKLAMELNYMQNGTRGATLGLEEEEVNLCFSTGITGLTFCDLRIMLEDFMETSVEMNKKLDTAKQFPVLNRERIA